MKSDDQGWRTIIKLLVVAGFLLFIVSLGMHHASGTQQHPAHKMAKAAQQATPPSDQATSHLTNLQKMRHLEVAASRGDTVDLAELKSFAQIRDAAAQVFLGSYYGANKHYGKAIFWYKKAATQGYAKAELNL
ncbi:sel1 repeat family protein, partial [Acidithiobacillus thiooxidans]|uniref:hypothetical protein n=1 Tax=Acidithiobacillus thiooxidans TaxID=930 RepID=UPI003F884BE5|nr:sel1 repeat family protein [Acidithiobacillus thiooxidans]